MSVANQEFLWVQKYRPKRFKNIILPERYRALFQNMIDTKVIQSMLLSGHHGTGKSTCAWALVCETGWDYMKLNASEESGIDVVRNKLKKFCQRASSDGNPKFVILEEADQMSMKMQSALRFMLEDFSAGNIFIFTCNYPDQIIPAIRDSRLKEIKFDYTPDDIEEMKPLFKERVFKILEKENVDVPNPKIVNRLIKSLMPDMRSILKNLQSMAIEGATRDKSGVIHYSLPESYEFQKTNLIWDDFYALLTEKNHTNMFKFVKMHTHDSIFHFVEENLEKFEKKELFAVIKLINEFDFFISQCMMRNTVMVEFLYELSNKIK